MWGLNLGSTPGQATKFSRVSVSNLQNGFSHPYLEAGRCCCCCCCCLSLIFLLSPIFPAPQPPPSPKTSKGLTVRRRQQCGHRRERAETEMRCWWGAHVGGCCLVLTAPGRRGCLCIRQEQRWTDVLVGLKATVMLGTSRKQKKPEEQERLMADRLLQHRAGTSSSLSLGLLGPNAPSPQAHPFATCQESLQTGGVTQPQYLWVLYASYHFRDWR